MKKARSHKPGKNAQTVKKITEKRVCCGCGACYVVCPASAIRIIYGQRYNFPEINEKVCRECGKCLRVCPSAFLLKGTDPGFSYYPEPEEHSCYLIHACDEKVWLHSASGGFITGFLLHMIETGQVDGAIVVKSEGANPLVAESFVAKDRESLMSALASKYCPVSSCTVLKDVIDRSGRYVFVGTPCMVQGLRNLQLLIPVLRERVLFAIGLVCSGMASRLATRRYIENDGQVDLSKVRRICYRGGGWPGRFRVYGKDGELLMERPTLGGAHDQVTSCDRYLRCWNCVDRWGRYADIVVSDPWTTELVETETKGWSAVMVRSCAARKAVMEAVNSGYLASTPIRLEEMLRYNSHLVIYPGHMQHAWMAVYQLLFFGRIEFLRPILRSMLRRRRIGLVTTFKARLDRRYYY